MGALDWGAWCPCDWEKRGLWCCERRAAERGEAASWPEIERDVVEMYAPNPTQRLGTPDDIADTIAFLSSPRAGYINGINVRVDGGLAGVP